MFRMFGFGGARCPRCDRSNPHAAGYCAGCGLSLGAPRRPVVLRDNRWMAGDDDLAVFFGVRALSGVFVKTLRVPPTARAYVLQGETATEVPPGEYDIEGFFTRLNHLLRDQHAEILVTRSTPLAVAFAFDGVASAEQLDVSVSLTVGIMVEQVPAFARHFMTMPGVIGGAELRALLDAPVRQVLAEFIGARSLREMHGAHGLRAALDERVHAGLTLLLARYGLAVSEVQTLALRHDRYDAQRAHVGTLWLAADARHAEAAHAQQLDVLYTADEWQRLQRDEERARQRHRRAEIAHEQAERTQALRTRQIALYASVAESGSREAAIARGAAEVLAELDQLQAAQAARRGGERDAWAHVRDLARLRMRTETEVAEHDAAQARQLAQQRFSHQLLQQQIRHKIEQAELIEDATRRRAELLRLREAEADAARRARELDEAGHAAQRQSQVLAQAALRRQAERLQEWEDALEQGRRRALARADALRDEQAAQQQAALRRAGAAQDAQTQHDKLLRTVQADAAQQRNAQELALEGEARRQALRAADQEAAWRHELRRLELDGAARAAGYTHAIALARLELERAQAIGALDEGGKLAAAGADQASALADYFKTRVHAGMRADQLQALAGVVGAMHGVTPEAAAGLAREAAAQERAAGEARSEAERRHQLALLAMQNDVNKAALAAQAQVQMARPASPALAGASLQQARCPYDHARPGRAPFCPACGARLGA